MNPKIMDIYKSQSDKKSVKIKKMSSRTKMNLLVDDDEDSESESISLNDIKDKQTLDKAVEIMLKQFKPMEYEIRETHHYAQQLPEKYYEPGSHALNRQVAFALKNTDERLFCRGFKFEAKHLISIIARYLIYIINGRNILTKQKIVLQSAR